MKKICQLIMALLAIGVGAIVYAGDPPEPPANTSDYWAYSDYVDAYTAWLNDDYNPSQRFAGQAPNPPPSPAASPYSTLYDQAVVAYNAAYDRYMTEYQQYLDEIAYH